VPDATTSLAVLVADTAFVTTSTELVIAEETARTASLEVTTAATTTLPLDTAALVAGAFEQTSQLDALLDGTFYVQTGMRVAISGAGAESVSLSCAVAESLSLTTDLSVATTDVVPFLIEPDRPRATPLLTLTDLYLGVHPNVISSPTTDFAAAGVSIGDVLEVTEGDNAGHYLIRAIETNVLYVHEAFPVRTAAALDGVVRQQRDRFATVTAAVVLDQAVFVAGTTVSAQLDLVIN